MKKSDMTSRMGDGLVLAYAEIEDAPIVAKAEEACFPHDPWNEGMVADAMENPSCRIYTVCDTQLSKIIAYGVVYFCLDEADIAKIAVVPERRGEGIGGALLDMILEDGEKSGILGMFLEVRQSNVSARGLYLSRGFKEIGIRRKYYRNPVEDAVMMARKEAF